MSACNGSVWNSKVWQNLMFFTLAKESVLFLLKEIFLDTAKATLNEMTSCAKSIPLDVVDRFK